MTDGFWKKCKLMLSYSSKRSISSKNRNGMKNNLEQNKKNLNIDVRKVKEDSWSECNKNQLEIAFTKD